MVDVPKVAVVGAGCAGSVAAWRMAQAGLCPVLFERSHTAGDAAACGGVMLHALGRRLQLPAELIDAEVHEIAVHEGDRHDHLYYDQPLFVSFDRGRMDRFLAERAASCGADLRTGCRAIGWSPSDGTVTWREERGERTQAFDTVVFADGPFSIARSTGIGLSRHSPMATAYYRELEGGDLEASRIRFFLPLPDSDPGYAWVFPKRSSIQVGLGRLTSTQGPPLRYLLDQFIDAEPELRERNRLRSGGGVIPVQTARRLSLPGGMVIGDAAGLVNPITGGGLVYAVASGEMAARAVVSGWRRGKDRAWVAGRFASAWRWSIHAAWLATLSRPFHLLSNRVRRGRPTHFNTFFRMYCVVLPRLTPAAREITLRMRRIPSLTGSRS